MQTNRNVHTNWSSRTATEFAVFAATYGCESWTLRKNEETCLDAFEMKGLRKILWVSAGFMDGKENK